MHHLHKVAGAVRTAMQVTLFWGAGELFPPRRACDGAGTGSEGRKNRVEVLNHCYFAANHQTIAAFKSLHTATRSGVHVVNAFRSEFFRALNVVDIVRISAVDEDIARLEV